MSSYTYYHCYNCGYHGSEFHEGRCPRCNSSNYHAEQENEQG